ncbi:undecaprenyl diphosphate synthase family protein [Staphylococcus epidermidis]|uniref:undecaprenyl diphosphate synthase family protein n=1 Tax=Staphylococcus epidermidis TaxID=1282 RepID=UPI0021B34D3F|nr:undecaprenyl diphosphate synthase family protein [Staphylococcus epidermidis]
MKRHLITHTYPHPHLLIPTSPQQTITNFLISQPSYTQFIFNQNLSPHFHQKHLTDSLKIYQSPQRPFPRLTHD